MIQTLVKKGDRMDIVKVHEGKKPSSCKICDKRLTQSGNLNGHMAAVHEVKKPFQCNICDLNFSQKGNLKDTYQQFMK